MSDINNSKEIITSVAKELAKDAYSDLGHPVTKPIGEVIGLIPRAIKAALEPVEKWVLQKEYNIEATKKLLEKKLEKIPPEQIEPPEAHIAVPALQYISYCMNNDELRDMYANLLSSSMCMVVKDDVHPGFVEIIKQLCPDEAKILKYIWKEQYVPTITVRYENEDGSGQDALRNFSNIGELTHCERPIQINTYFDNLIRLGLIENAGLISSLTNKELYEPIKKHPVVTLFLHEGTIKKTPFKKSSIKEGFMRMTNFGRKFCDICLSTPDNHLEKQTI